MEKYSKFGDASTGIQPFRRLKSNTDLNGIQGAVAWLLSAITVPIAYCLLTLYFYLLKPLFIPQIITRIVLKYLVLAFIRLFYSSFIYDGERRASVRKSSLIRPKAGDVLLSNFVSPLDPLIYESNYNTHFAFPASGGQFKVFSTLQAVYRALDIQPLSGEGTSLQELSVNAKKQGAILVVFVEGTTSNGRGLLSLKNLDVRNIAAVDSQVFPAAIKYMPQTACSPMPSSLWTYLWNASRLSWWYMATVKIAGEPMAKGTISTDTVSKGIAAMGRLRILGERMNIETKREYAAAEVRK